MAHARAEDGTSWFIFAVNLYAYHEPVDWSAPLVQRHRSRDLASLDNVSGRYRPGWAWLIATILPLRCGLCSHIPSSLVATIVYVYSVEYLQLSYALLDARWKKF